MKVCIAPTYKAPDQADGGIRRVVDAMAQYLPEFDVQVVDEPRDADLLNVHGTIRADAPGLPVVSSTHGLYWHDYDWPDWAYDANARVTESLTRAQAATAPSQWVAHAISRGLLMRPTVIYHGVDSDLWTPSDDPMGYVLWNKARADAVSNPADMQRVALQLPDVPFLSTFGQPAPNVRVFGAVPYAQMRTLVQRAGVYLATARETFGIGTLEALAAGVPVAGWRYGGQAEIVVEGETGHLAPYGDYDALAGCIAQCLQERHRLGPNARADAVARWGWRDKVQQYAQLFQQVAAGWYAKRPKVSVIITTHNLARYLGDALDSVRDQTRDDWECLIIDDASDDDPAKVVKAHWDSRFHYLRTPENLKLSGARNYGWQQANGKYIIFLDADDMLASSALDTLSAALDARPDIHIAYGHLDVLHDNKRRERPAQWPFDAFDYKGQMSHLNQLPYSAMLRREVLERSGGYRTRDWRAEDAALWCRLTSFGFRAEKVTQESTLIYRLRNDSKSADEGRAYADRDGDWTAWYPWRLAGSADEGAQAQREKRQLNPQLVPWGAQAEAPRPLKGWPVRHHQHPVISVIIPVGPGHARYVGDALDSVQAQTLPQWEAIVVNDTGAALDLTAWPWARAVATAGKVGAGAARNAGLRAARAPLVCFLDADDILTPRALEALLERYTQGDAGYVYSDWVSLDDDTRLDGPGDIHAVPEYDEQLWLQGFQHPVTALVPTEDARAVGGFDERLEAWEDWKFYLDLIARGLCGARVAQPLLVYRLSTGQRRNVAKAHEAELLATIYGQYQDERTGAKQMASCCGGRASTVAAGMTALEDLLAPNFPDAAQALAAIPQAATSVRLEFTGDAFGAQTFIGRPSNRIYRAGRDPAARYHDADPRDVAHLLGLGVFQIITLPVEAVAV